MFSKYISDLAIMYLIILMVVASNMDLGFNNDVLIWMANIVVSVLVLVICAVLENFIELGLSVVANRIKKLKK